MRILNNSKTNRTSISDRIHEELRQSICTGEIPSGTRLVEADLAKQKGVSRTPVREALRTLASEGFVYPIPRVGYIVEGMSEYEIRDLFATRSAIERLAAKWAVARITPEVLAELENDLTRMEKALKTRDEATIVESDRHFHETIYRACGSKIVNEISKVIAQHILKFRIKAVLIPEVGERVLKGHWEIFKAMSAHDAQKVDDAVASHLEIAQKDIFACITNDVQQRDILL